MPILRRTLLATLVAILGAVPAAAWPYIDVTASEVLSLEPPRFRTTFDLSFAGYHPLFDPGFFVVAPLDPSTLHLLECAAPPLWVCGPTLPGEEGGFFFSSYWGTGAPYAPVNTFSIVTDAMVPCVQIRFYDPVLARAPTPTTDSDYFVDACLAVDAPVPAPPATWGALKVRYR